MFKEILSKTKFASQLFCLYIKSQKCQLTDLRNRYIEGSKKCISRDVSYYRAKEIKYFKEKIEKGFETRDLWNLDVSLAELILPRLKAFQEFHCSSDEDFNEALSKMIQAFEIITSSDFLANHNPEKNEAVSEGLKLFAEYYLSLWN